MGVPPRAFHLVKISGISGSAENGTPFVGSSHWKIPRKSGKSKKVGPFSRLEFPSVRLNGTTFYRGLSVFSTGKFPEKVENLKRWARFPGWNFRTECRVPFMFLVVCTSSRSTVGHRDIPGFTTKWNNFLPIGNSTFAPTEISGFFS